MQLKETNHKMARRKLLGFGAQSSSMGSEDVAGHLVALFGGAGAAPPSEEGRSLQGDSSNDELMDSEAVADDGNAGSEDEGSYGEAAASSFDSSAGLSSAGGLQPPSSAHQAAAEIAALTDQLRRAQLHAQQLQEQQGLREEEQQEEEEQVQGEQQLLWQQQQQPQVSAERAGTSAAVLAPRPPRQPRRQGELWRQASAEQAVAALLAPPAPRQLRRAGATGGASNSVAGGARSGRVRSGASMAVDTPSTSMRLAFNKVRRAENATNL